MILGIESSCDESALAVFAAENGLRWEAVHTQAATHAVHGGVVPELAVREHVQKFPQLMDQIPSKLFSEIKKVAVTVGPGLAGSLAMGMALARALGLRHGWPVVGVNHLRAHAWSVFIKTHEQSVDGNTGRFEECMKSYLPHLGLLASGGNTLLYRIDKDKRISVMARTVDDAAGECLDKVAKMLELPYPGAPLLEKLAAQGDARKYSFPVPFIESHQLAYSFSGLKTAMRYRLQAMSPAEIEQEKPHLAASFQHTVVQSLVLMVRRALRREGNIRSLGISGGVAQNLQLRDTLAELARVSDVPLLLAERKHCGDNAAMVAWAAWVDEGGLLPVEKFLPGLRIDQVAP